MENKKRLVLVVDDVEANRKLLGNLLVNNNYDVGSASDGNRALEFIKNKHPDLILLDIIMPGMDGYEVCEKLKSNLETKYIPIIFLTAKANMEDIVKGFELGGVDYVSKPFNEKELLARVKTHIELNTLRSLLPICMSCKNIRDEDGYWQSIERYFNDHSNVNFSHCLCKDCAFKLYGDQEWYDPEEV